MDTGSRASVYHGAALKTAGGLRRKDLYKNKRGRIVSMKKSRAAKSWNPLKMLGLLSRTGEPFGARTFRKGTRSISRLGASGQRVLDFVTHKGSRIKRHGKKYKAYYSRKGSRRKTNKWKLGRDYSQSGGTPLTYSSYPGTASEFEMPVNTPEERALMASGGRSRGGAPLTYSSYPGATPEFEMPVYTPEERALMASGGRRLRGGNSLAMTNLDSAYPSQLNEMDMSQNTPLNRALDAGA
jgi:hypothetical protein